MALATLIKFALGLMGITITMILLIVGLIKKDNKTLKRAGLVFVGTWLILVILGIVEFLLLANI